MRGRKPNKEKTKTRIFDALKDNPSGLTLRELSRQTGIPKSTLAYHLTNYHSHMIDETVVSPKGRNLLRLIKLR